jgi:hypothetical protein
MLYPRAFKPTACGAKRLGKSTAAHWKNFLSLAAAVVLLLPLPAAAVTIQDVVNGVSQADYTSFHSNSLFTHLGNDRGAGKPDHDAARTNIYNALADLGLTPTLEPFNYYGYTFYNVVATLPGTVHPDQVYLLGAHYDSVDNPGADDDASGVASVITAARALAPYAFESTVQFVLFDLEEKVEVGSTAYVAAHGSDNILGMIALDMIAYPADYHNQALVCYAEDDSPLTQQLAANLQTYGGIAATIIQRDGSDHRPFDEAGFNAAHLLESGRFYNTHYHQPTDAVETESYIDYAYATNMTRGVVGYLATSAALVPEPSALALLAAGALTLFACVRWSRRRYK